MYGPYGGDVMLTRGGTAVVTSNAAEIIADLDASLDGSSTNMTGTTAHIGSIVSSGDGGDVVGHGHGGGDGGGWRYGGCDGGGDDSGGG